ncbi:DUF6310 domain-containing protein [Methylocaldum sp. MU1018]
MGSGLAFCSYLDVVVAGPQGPRRLSYSRIAGDEMVVGVDPAGIGFDQVRQRFQTTPADTAAENLHQLALHYWAESDHFNRLSQTAYDATLVRLPSVGVFSSPLSVLYNFGLPRTGYYLKRNIDIKLSQHAVAAPDPKKRLDYIAQIGVIGSYLESSIQEQLFRNWQGTGLSTMQVFLDANAQRIPISTLTAANAPSLLGRLQIPADALADIQAALAAGYEVRVPERTPTKTVGVSGIGYEIRDPQTGSASYRIWGGTNGGDGETPCAERQRRPLAEVVRDVVLTVIALEMLVLAGWYLPVLISGLAGVAGEAAPALAAIMASVGLSTLDFPATTGTDLCQAIPIPRKGGSDGYQSGLCADSLGNVYTGQDVCVKGVAFDALSVAKTLWEVKVINFSNTPDFIVDSQIKTKDIPQLRRQQNAIAECPQYQLGWAVADLWHFLLQKNPYNWDSEVNLHWQVPQCFDLPMSPSEP